MSAIGMLCALAVGVAFGYGAQRGAFCMNSGMRGAIEGDWTKLKALGLAVAVQLLALPLVFLSGWARPAELSLHALAAVVGGVLFGASMPWAGGCAAGVWYKLGAGDVGALLATLGMAIGATASDTGPLLGGRVSLQAVGAPVSWTPASLISLSAGLVLLAALARRPDSRAGAWSWRRTGIWIGLVATLAWPVSNAAGRDFGLAVVPGTTGLLSAVAGQRFPVWDLVLVLGILAGGSLAASRTGKLSLTAPTPKVLLKRFLGGLGLGVGASIASGCTVGQGVTGLGLLAPSSFVVMGAIFAGSTAATLIGRRLQPGSASLVASSAPR